VIWHELAGIALAVVGLAVFATAVQPGSQTGAILGQATGGFANVISAAKGASGGQTTTSS
jgi:hypothetical protein